MSLYMLSEASLNSLQVLSTTSVKSTVLPYSAYLYVFKKIIITERKGKLKIKIQLNADFSTHIDFLHDDDDPMYKSHGDILVVKK